MSEFPLANLLVMTMRPEAIMGFLALCVLAFYVYFIWVRSIMQIRDPNVKTKTPAIVILVLFGILPIIVYAYMSYRKGGRTTNNMNGTSFSANGAPAPVA